MVINFDKVPRDLDGTEFTEKDAPIKLKSFCVNALLANYPDEPMVLGEEKLARYLLAQKINKGKDVDLTPEELTKVRMLIGKAYPPLIVGATYALLS